MDLNIPLDDLIIFETPEEKEASTPDEPIQEPIVDTPAKVEEPVEDTKTSDSADYTPYYEVLKETGALTLPEDFEFDGTEESFSKALETSKNQVREETLLNIWQALPEDFRPLLQYGLNGGQSLEEYMSVFSSDVSKLSVATPEDQKKIIYQYLKTTSKHPEERIQRIISRYEDEDLLEETAKDFLVDLKEIEEERKADLVEKAKVEAQQRKAEAEKIIEGINSSIASIDTDASRKNKLRAFFFNEVELDNRKATEFDLVINSIKSNPSHMVQLADILLEYTSKDGFNMERFTKKGETKATKTFEKLLEQKLDPKTKSTRDTIKAAEDFNWDEFNKK